MGGYYDSGGGAFVACAEGLPYLGRHAWVVTTTVSRMDAWQVSGVPWAINGLQNFVAINRKLSPRIGMQIDARCVCDGSCIVVLAPL